MHYFSPDFKYLYIKEGDTVTGIPMSEMTTEEKKLAYELVAMETYA